MKGICRLNFPGRRMGRTLCRYMLPTLAVQRRTSARSLRTRLCRCLRCGRLSGTVGTLGTLITSIPCDGGGLTSVSVRRHCHLVVDAVLGTVNLGIRMRRVLSANEVSLVIGAARRVCVVRLGLEGGKNGRTTVARVQSQRCLRPFGTSGQRMMNLNVRLSRRNGNVLS